LKVPLCTFLSPSNTDHSRICDKASVAYINLPTARNEILQDSILVHFSMYNPPSLTFSGKSEAQLKHIHM